MSSLKMSCPTSLVPSRCSPHWAVDGDSHGMGITGSQQRGRQGHQYKEAGAIPRLPPGRPRTTLLQREVHCDSFQPWQLPANFKQRGDAWIRDAYAEFYDNRGNLLGGQDVGISISGGASSYLDVKSFKLSANWNRTGETADFPASWFMTAATEQTEPLAVDSYNKIIVRNERAGPRPYLLALECVVTSCQRIGLDPRGRCHPGNCLSERRVLQLHVLAATHK